MYLIPKASSITTQLHVSLFVWVDGRSPDTPVVTIYFLIFIMDVFVFYAFSVQAHYLSATRIPNSVNFSYVICSQLGGPELDYDNLKEVLE